MSKEINISEIGIVKITKRRGVKRMTLSVRPFKPISVTIPYSVSFSAAESFVREKKDWIIRNQKKVSAREGKRTRFTAETKFRTRERELVFVLSNKTQISIIKSYIKIEYTGDEELLTNENQDYIRKGIIEALRLEAKSYIPDRTELLAKKFNFNYSKVSVRNAKTRWGSCSGKNNISLNIQLMRLPDFLIDYIILHELCHTVEKNHGKHFWALLDKVSGDAKGMDKALKAYSPSIY